MSKEVREKFLASSMLAGLAALSLSVPANAQQAPAAPASGEAASANNEIIVTGSRIRRETLDSAIPTLSVGAQEVESRQFSNAVDAIEDIPLLGFGSNNRGTQTQNGDSFAFPDILDLGTQRTLTLLNGRRVVSNNVGAVLVPDNASGSQVDLSFINPQLIDRIDVVVGTGGAVYGADAVAGVVNIITKTDFEGLDLNLQGGISERGEGEQYRVSGLWGKNFLNGRANLTVSGDYFKQEPIFASTDRPVRYLGSAIANRLEGSVRDSSVFDPAAAVQTLLAGGTLNAAFLPQASDGQPSNFFGPLSITNPLVSSGGVFLTGGLTATIPGSGAQAIGQLSVSGNNTLIPDIPVAPVLAGVGQGPGGLPFFAPTALPTGLTAATVFAQYGVNPLGLTATQQSALALQLLQRNRPTPLEHFQANPNLNPLLFAGTFGPLSSGAGQGTLATNIGAYPILANTDPATSALFPRIAVPLAFDANGNLVAYNIGDLTTQARLSSAFNSGGYDSTKEGHVQAQAGTERFSFAAFGGFEITDNIRARTEISYTKLTFDQIQAVQTNGPSGSTTAGSLSVPIYLNQNPFVTTATRNTINSLVSQGLVLPQIGPTGNTQPVFFVGRALSDVLNGGIESTTETKTYRVAQSFEGDFEFLGRNFYWDIAASYGRSETTTQRQDMLDIEFALATDVVMGPGGVPVCRQQTLAAPESIRIRNPGMASIVNVNGLVPTAEQVARCVPLNIMGANTASAAARNYVIGNADNYGLNTQEYYAGSFGGDLVKLPAGPLSFSVQVERRNEAAEFEPSDDTRFARARTAIQDRGEGSLDFTEYGIEALLPVFSEDFNVPFFNALEFNYAFRQVEREQQSSTVPFTGSGTDDDTFSYGFRYKPYEDLTFRGSRSRSVRSASLVELVGPFTQAFTNLNANTNVCVTSAIDSGPNPTARRANCVAAVQALGIAATPAEATTFLSTFIGTAGTRSAIAAGNPGAINEEANNYTLGVTYEPSWAPRLVIAADFISIDLQNEIGLTGPGTMVNGCFDSTAFPNSIVGGARACDTFQFGVQPGGPGTAFLINGATNPITGNPSNAGILGGTPAPFQAPFELAFAQFTNLNLGKREFRGVNVEARYNFRLEELPIIGENLGKAGELFIRTSAFNAQRYDVFGNGVNLTDRQVGEHPGTGVPEWEVRTDFRHKIGKLDHTLQWYWTPRTVSDSTVRKELWPEQSRAFVAPTYSFFNYAAAYEINDNLIARLVVNNLTDSDEPRDQFGLANSFDGGMGREFIFGINAKF